MTLEQHGRRRWLDRLKNGDKMEVATSSAAFRDGGLLELRLEREARELRELGTAGLGEWVRAFCFFFLFFFPLIGVKRCRIKLFFKNWSGFDSVRPTGSCPV
ncbi:hypothetical protein AAHE18_08G010500 [Arachis hypogaea]